MPSLIISSASRSLPRIFIYHSSYIFLIPSSFHSIILAFFTFPLIHFTMVLFAISSKLIFFHFIYHTLLFILSPFFLPFSASITLIYPHPSFPFPFPSMIPLHSFLSIPIPFLLSSTSITLTHIHFHSFSLILFFSFCSLFYSTSFHQLSIFLSSSHSSLISSHSHFIIPILSLLSFSIISTLQFISSSLSLSLLYLFSTLLPTSIFSSLIILPLISILSSYSSLLYHLLFTLSIPFIHSFPLHSIIHFSFRPSSDSF